MFSKSPADATLHFHKSSATKEQLFNAAIAAPTQAVFTSGFQSCN
jgi:hypothetical protein